VAEKEQFYSFEEALRELRLKEEELKRLVSEGEIRAFRDKNTMRFKAEDVARLRGQRVAPQDVELDDLELELEDEAEIASAGTVESSVESIDLGDVSVTEELVLEEASPTGEVIDIGEGGLEAPAEAESAVRLQRVTSGGARRAPRAAPAAASAEPVESITEGGAMLVLMMAGALLLIVANFLVLDAAVGRASSALTRAVANMFS